MLVAVQIFGWGTQFVGHGIFERRAPAVLTNIFFMFIAPFFWTFEVLNKLFGYKDAEILEYEPTIEADIAFYRQKRGFKQRRIPGKVLNKNE